MPYVDKEARVRLESGKPRSAGELNYAITRLIKAYLSVGGTNYTTINEIVGVLECAKMEFYRRVTVPYEDTKIVENGDVY